MTQDTTLSEDDIKKLAQRGGMDLGDQQTFWEFFSDTNDLVYGGGASNLYSGRTFRWVDDWCFNGPLYATLYGSGTPIGSPPYTATLGGTGRLLGITGTGRLGVVAMHAGETADGQCRLHTCAMGAFDGGGSLNMDRITFEAVVAFDTKSTALEGYVAEIGLVGNAPGYGCFFRYDETVGGHKWLAVTEEGGSETVVILDGTTNGGFATVDGGTIDNLSLPDYGFFRLKVVYTGTTGVGTSAAFYVNDVLCTTITSTLPTHSLAGSVDMQKTAGTTTRYLALDYTDLKYEFRLDRVP